MSSSKLARKTISHALAPRLAELARQRLSQPQDGSLYNTPLRKRKRRVSTRPHPGFSATNRGGRSILLDPVNPITNADVYARHKMPEPALRADKPGQRLMSRNERLWSSNPYLRMLSTEIRRCVLTSRYLPSDLLIRLSLQRIPLREAPQGAQSAKNRNGSIIAILPDNDAFSERHVNGRGFYITCSRALFQQISSKGLESGLDKRYELHPELSNYVGHLLRQQVIASLVRFAPALRKTPHALSDISIVRQMTKLEWDDAQQFGTVKVPDAHAIIYFREPAAHMAPNSDAASTGSESEPSHPPIIPFFHIECEGQQQYPVPLYDMPTFFPDAEQREAVEKSLHSILDVQSAARRKYRSESAQQSPPDEESALSNVFLISSGADTVLRTDIVPALIALWRLRMWEDFYGDVESHGLGWQNANTVLV